MQTKQEKFISVIAPLAQAEYINRDRWVLPSVCIAQAALESGWNLKAKTLFGIKGTGTTLKTTEYINGKYVSTTASFKAYPSLAAAVHGYYDLITGSHRYSGAVNCSDYYTAVRAIANGGYATDPDYANKVIRIIVNYGLMNYDNRTSLTPAENVSRETSDIDAVARDVIAGRYGNGNARRAALTRLGYDYQTVQTRVNEMLKGAT